MLLWPRCVDPTVAVAVDKNAGLERFQEVVEYRGQPRDFGALHAEMDGDGAAPRASAVAGRGPTTSQQLATARCLPPVSPTKAGSLIRSLQACEENASSGCLHERAGSDAPGVAQLGICEQPGRVYMAGCFAGSGRRSGSRSGRPEVRGVGGAANAGRRSGGQRCCGLGRLLVTSRRTTT